MKSSRSMLTRSERNSREPSLGGVHGFAIGNTIGGQRITKNLCALIDPPDFEGGYLSLVGSILTSQCAQDEPSTVCLISFFYRFDGAFSRRAAIRCFFGEINSKRSPNRFEKWSSPKSQSLDGVSFDREQKVSTISRLWLKVLTWISRISKGMSSSLPSWHQPAAQPQSNKKILNPQGSFLQKWNKIFVLICVLAIAVDPLFCYIPVVDDKDKCLELDRTLAIAASVLRSFTDLFYILHIIFQFRTGFIAPSSRVFGRGVLVEDSYKIAVRYLTSYFIVDVLAVLPLPQAIVLSVVVTSKRDAVLKEKNFLIFVIILQYLPRLIRIIPLYREVTRTSGIITQAVWAGAAVYLILYMLAGHILGATWYLLSIERQDSCWKAACRKSNVQCDRLTYFCGPKIPQITTLLNSSCPLDPADPKEFDFGIYLSALQSVANTHKFAGKLFFCLWWGLRNLSSLGQGLETSAYAWENMFAVFISVAGLVLFALLIGNMQTYLQSTTVKKIIEEMRVRRSDTDQWMSHRLLPPELRERIRRHEQYTWQVTRGVNEESILQNLPRDLRRDIKRHVCLSLLNRVPMFGKMEEQIMDVMVDRLKPALYTSFSWIVQELDPVDEMLFIMRGRLESTRTNSGRSGFFNVAILVEGDFCGEELLSWALDPNTSAILPSSTRTVRALTDVEAFVLKAEDLKFVASQSRILHSEELRHTFRYHSYAWRMWAACFIQAAWRRFVRRKMEEALREEEAGRKTAALGSGATSFGAALYVSRFAANALRNLKKGGGRKGRTMERMPAILLQKPAEPDFTIDEKK